MLNRLAEYAQRKGLSSKPGFAARNIHWVLDISSDGTPLGPVDRCTLQGRKRVPATVAAAPELPNSLLRTGERSHFLLESVAVVFNSPAKPTETEAAKTKRKHDFFLQTLQSAAGIEPRCMPVYTLLSSPGLRDKALQMVLQAGAKRTENISFSVGGVLLLDLTSWHSWWTNYIASLQNAPAGCATAIDLLSGNPCAPARTHPAIAGLTIIGGRATSFLISFDKAAFESFGLSQSANAALSELSARTYVDAFNELIRQQSTRTQVGDSVVLHWFDGNVPTADDPFALLEDPPQSAEIDAHIRAHQLLEAIRTGKRPDLANYHYYAMGISSSGARVMVRFWMEGALRELVERIEQWFDALQIVHPDGTIRSSTPLRDLAKAGIPDRESNNESSRLALRRLAMPLLRSAMQGTPIPVSVAAAALERLRAEVSSLKQGDSEFRLSHHPARMALLRAFVNRFMSQKGASPLTPVTPDLDQQSPHVAYHCGRLMAALAQIQRAALGDVGAGVVQRYYAAASATPALVFGRLLRGAQYHLGKLDPPLAMFFDERLGEITGAIGRSMPATLDLEGQTLFALGYYHQLISMRQHAKERSAQRRIEETSSENKQQGERKNA
jgi:CRISPR-associated protein Csd1